MLEDFQKLHEAKEELKRSILEAARPIVEPVLNFLSRMLIEKKKEADPKA